jgi:hypothetical protein
MVPQHNQPGARCRRVGLPRRRGCTMGSPEAQDSWQGHTRLGAAGKAWLRLGWNEVVVVVVVVVARGSRIQVLGELMRRDAGPAVEKKKIGCSCKTTAVHVWIQAAEASAWSPLTGFVFGGPAHPG